MSSAVLEKHPKEASLIVAGCLELFDALLCASQITHVDVPIKLKFHGSGYCLAKPCHHWLSQPGAGLANQLNFQVAPSSTTIFLIGQDDSVETEIEHANFRVVGQSIEAMGIMEEIRIVQAMLLAGLFEPPQELFEFGRCIERRIPASDAPERKTVKFNDYPFLHGLPAFVFFLS